MTPETLSSGLVPNPPLLTPYVPPTKKDWDTLFQLMFDEYFNPLPSVASTVPVAVAPVPANSTGSPSSTLVDEDAQSPSTLQTPQASQSQLLLLVKLDKLGGVLKNKARLVAKEYCQEEGINFEETFAPVA
ncbi:hypothetical protein Tco_0014846 [Tanacetum coccineum]